MKAKQPCGKLEARKARVGWIFVAPFLVGFVLIYMQVFINSIVYSFVRLEQHEIGYDMVFVGWKHYYEVLFVNTEFNQKLVSSITGMIFNVPFILIFSLFIAVLLSHKVRGRGIFRAIFFLPVIMATGIIAMAENNNRAIVDMWQMGGIQTGAGSSGLLDALDVRSFLLSLNINTEFTEYIVAAADNIYNILNMSGVQMLIFLAGLQSISPAIYESARIEGATEWETFWKITFPMISPLIFLNLVYSIIDSFTNSQNKLIELINDMGNNQSFMELSSAMAWIYTVVTLVFIITAMLLASRFVFYQQRDDRGR